jgi:hypothetical protein
MAGLVWWAVGIDSMPSYQGLPAGYWLTNGDVNAFRAMGPPGARFLGRVWEMEPSNLASNKDYYLNLIGLARYAHFQDEDDSRMELRGDAAKILEELRRDAGPAWPSFLRVFRRPNSDSTDWRETAWLMKPMGLDIGFFAPELLGDLLRSDELSGDNRASSDQRDNAEERVVADIDLLGAIGPPSKNAIPTLLHCASTPSPFSRMRRTHAAVALWNIDARTNVLIDVISNEISSRDRDGAMAIRDLGDAKAPPKFLGPILERALHNPYREVREWAEFRLSQIDSERLKGIAHELNSHQSELLQQHIELLKSTNVIDRLNALEAIRFFGPEGAQAEPLLARILAACLARNSTTTANRQTTMVERIELIKEQGAAVRALKEINAKSPASASALMDLSRTIPGPDEDLLSALATAGRDSSDVLPYLRQRLANCDQRVGYGPHFIARAICSIAPDDLKAIEVLKFLETNAVGLSSNGLNIVQTSAAVTLWELGVEKMSPIDLLSKQVDAPPGQAFDRTWAIDLLGEIGPTAREALPELEKFMNAEFYPYPNPSLRAHIAMAIRKIDPDKAKRLDLPGVFIICPDKL